MQWSGLVEQDIKGKGKWQRKSVSNEMFCKEVGLRIPLPFWYIFLWNKYRGIGAACWGKGKGRRGVITKTWKHPI